jgi:hypothetical protein
MYLKILTWSEAGLDGNAIYGRLQDLRRLSGIVAAKLQDVYADARIRDAAVSSLTFRSSGRPSAAPDLSVMHMY